MRRLLLLLSLLVPVALVAQGVQIPPAPSLPVSLIPGFNITTCPPPPNSLAVCSLFTSTTQASNVNTGETDLITYQMPGGVLSLNNQKVRITAVFSAANNANLKNARVYFGAQSLVEQGFTTQSPVRLIAEVFRTGATAQQGTASWFGTNLHVLGLTNPSATLSGAVTIKLTGQSAVASNDVTAISMIVEWVP